MAVPLFVRPAWYDRARCAGLGPDLFYVEQQGVTQTGARALCLECETRRECLAAALARPEEYGMWGGCSARERGRLRGAAAAR